MNSFSEGLVLGPGAGRGRPQQRRQLKQESASYLPRQACHMSLPPGKVACHLHEALRLSGLVAGDQGPAASD